MAPRNKSVRSRTRSGNDPRLSALPSDMQEGASRLGQAEERSFQDDLEELGGWPPGINQRNPLAKQLVRSLAQGKRADGQVARLEFCLSLFLRLVDQGFVGTGGEAEVQRVRDMLAAVDRLASNSIDGKTLSRDTRRRLERLAGDQERVSKFIISAAEKTFLPLEKVQDVFLTVVGALRDASRHVWNRRPCCYHYGIAHLKSGGCTVGSCRCEEPGDLPDVLAGLRA